MTIDNTDADWKIRIRQQVERFPVSRRLCVELCAGAGTMTRFWAATCESVVAIDEAAEKLKEIGVANARTVCGNNRELVHETANSEIVDCDGYGLVMPLLRLVLAASTTKKKFIAFTDGTPKAAHFNSRRDTFKNELVKLSPTQFHYERNYQGGVYYGYAYWEDCSQVSRQLKIHAATLKFRK